MIQRTGKGTPRLRFKSYEELNAWLLDRCVAWAKAQAHPEVRDRTIWALVLALVIGRRRGFPDEVMAPHGPGMTMAGASMLWVGWFGFNGGSALAANGNAGMAIAVTHFRRLSGELETGEHEACGGDGEG